VGVGTKLIATQLGSCWHCKVDGYSLCRVIEAQVMLAWGIFRVQKLSNTRCEEKTEYGEKQAVQVEVIMVLCHCLSGVL